MTTASSSHSRSFSGLLGSLGAAAAALALAVGSAQAAPGVDPATGAPTVSVRYDDLNLGTAAGAHALYRRIVSAAQQVCPRAEPWDMDLYRASHACQARAIERAVREVHDPRLAAVYEHSGKG
jgi:UrcA family protein